MAPQTYVIVQLPPTPQIPVPQALELHYEPDTGGGTFSYGGRPLQLAYTCQDTTISNAHPTGITKTRTSPPSPRVSCSRWVNDFGDWPIGEDSRYTGQAVQDVATETERKSRYFSGFVFDPALQVWAGTWELRDRQQVFNSTFDDSTTVELRLNLVDGTGSYREHRSMDMLA
ncbi:MAG: hypothetical protein Fur0042_23230 [Cyanophyceae cyanobacterium]